MLVGVEVKPHDFELIDPVSIKYRSKSICTSIVSPSSSLFHCSMDPSMSSSLEYETCIIYTPNLDQTHELDMIIGLEDYVEDFDSCLICALIFFVKHLGPYPLH